MQSRCYLCLQKTKYNDALLCTNCYCLLQNYQWLTCARCGNRNCAGCNALSDFSKVTSLYSYKDTLAHILILAKEDNNISAQKVFNELFFVPVKNHLLKILSQENYHFIIIAPLRKDRIFHGAWHPNIFYDEVLQYIYRHELTECIKPQILFPHYSSKKKKQSLLPIERRKTKNLNLELIYNNVEFKEESDSKVLLLDDVLTTGESSLLCKSLSSKIFPLAKEWDLFTILRAPQS